MFRQISWVVTLLGCVSAAVGQEQNWIYQHNEYYNNPQNPGWPFYDVDQRNRTILVYHGVPNQDFMFEAVVEDANHQYIEPGDIDLIETVGNPENVVVTVVGHNGHPYGAADIRQARIGAAGYTGTIKELNISGDLGELGPVEADVLENVTVAGDVYYLASRGAITGRVTVGDDVLYGLYAYDAITGPVTIMGDLCAHPDGAQLNCASLGSLTVGGDVVGDIYVEGAITGPMTVTRGLCTRPSGAELTCGSLAGLTVGGDVVGDIEVTGDITGPVTIDGACIA